MESVVDIYGHLYDNTEIVIGVGNYNNIHGLACYYPNDDLLQIRSIPEIIAPSVVELILHYETNKNSRNRNKLYFSLEVKSHNLTSKYIGVDIESINNQTVASAVISSEKTLFTIDYSSIDNTPRSHLISGSLYSLQTTLGEHEYIVSWKINGFSNGDLVVFLPTSWYENINNTCTIKNGINNLLDNLAQLKFKGFTTEKWCETASHVINCSNDTFCGDCFGHCQNNKHICWPNDNKFICGSPENEPDMSKFNLVSFADTTPQTSGTAATLVAVIAIIIIVSVLALGLIIKYYDTNN